MADWFSKTCREAFAFLVTKYSFRVTVSAGSRDAMVSFYRPDAIVNVMSEGSATPWVTINTGGRTFGLHKAIARIDPTYAKRAPKNDSAIAYYAAFLKKHTDEVLEHIPRKPPPPAAVKKARATRAGPLDFLATELGWARGSIRQVVAPKMTTLVFHDEVVRLTIDFVDGKGLDKVCISARSKSADLDVAIKTLAPDLVRPKDPHARLAYYAAFLCERGKPLLEAKRSAWSKL